MSEVKLNEWTSNKSNGDKDSYERIEHISKVNTMHI